MTEKGAHALSLSFSRVWLPRGKNPVFFPDSDAVESKSTSIRGGELRKPQGAERLFIAK
jgi:hypothetical protein